MWMFVLLDSGVVNTRRQFLMLKCLMLMRLHTVAHRYHHFTDGLNGRIKGSMNNVLEVEMGSFTPRVL